MESNTVLPRWLWGVLLLFFFVTAWFAVVPRGHFNSPDEMANAVFSRRIAEGQPLQIPEPLNREAGGRIHPRAMTVAGEKLVPGGFLGLILLYGWIARIFGAWILPLLTPLVATLALVCFFSILSSLFNRRVATLATLLLAVHPAWLYYTGRAFFPNVPFLAFLLFGGLALFRMIERGRPRDAFLSGLSIGIALTIRTTELGWVLFSLLFLFVLIRRMISWRSLLFFGVAFIIPFLPILFTNMTLYGHPFSTGYAQIDREAVPAAFAWKGGVLFLPFGIQPALLFHNAFAYLLSLFWWFALPMIFGSLLFLKTQWRKGRDRTFWFFCSFLFVTTWLVLYYGSWDIRDSTLTSPTLGTSFVRYWLPVFVFGLPFTAWAILYGIRRTIVQRGVVTVLVLLSLASSLLVTDENLLALRTVASDHDRLRQEVLAETEDNALILSERLDKVFFPERRVMVDDLRDRENIDRVVAALLSRIPVYRVTEQGENDIAFSNTAYLARLGVRWTFQKDVGAFHLYQLEQR